MVLTYVLDEEHAPQPCDDVLLWSLWMADIDNRRVDRTVIGNEWLEVSTIFLGLNYSMSKPPKFFETMVFEREIAVENFPGTKMQYFFQRSIDSFTMRWSTWQEALIGHEEVVKQVEATNPELIRLRKPIVA